MSADLLRQAATILRERAEAATPGPWRSTTGIAPNVLGPREPEDLGGGLASILRANLPLINGQRRREANVAYSATMHPGVGLALADWLLVQSHHVASGQCEAHCEYPDGCDETASALAVARLIVGGAS
jgi:hypothetical protein